MVIMKVLRIIKNIILDIIIVLLLFIVGFEFLNKDKPLNIFNHYLFRVMSGSMQNTLKVGDYIIVKKSNDYKPNDIITYKNKDIYITHRIVKINGDKVITKGDANKSEDQEFNKKYIIGKCVYKSNILNFIMNNKIIIILFVIIIMLITSLIENERKMVKNE